jgi:hypothetical protein
MGEDLAVSGRGRRGFHVIGHRHRCCSAMESNSISRINGDIAQLTGALRAQVDQAVAVSRKHWG